MKIFKKLLTTFATTTLLAAPLFGMEEDIQLSDLPEEMVNEILYRTNYRDWDKLRTVNKMFNSVLKTQTVRLSMNLSKLSTRTKKSILRPQSKHSCSRGIFQIHFYKDGKEVQYADGYVAPDAPYRGFLPDSFDFSEVSIKDNLRLPKNLGELEMVVHPSFGGYCYLRSEDYVACRQTITDISNLESIEIVSSRHPWSTSGESCKIQTKYQ